MMVCLLRDPSSSGLGDGRSSRFSRRRQYKIGKVFEDPVVLWCSIDNSQKLSRQRNDGFSRAAEVLDLFVVLFQIRVVALRNQRALDQYVRRPLQPDWRLVPVLVLSVRLGR